MILLPVDEAFAMDYLAILYVKRNHGLDVYHELQDVIESLGGQLPNWISIVESEEFHEMIEANEATFNEVSKAGNTPVQLANYRRYIAKQKLQALFWPHVPLMERKRPQGT